MPHHLRLLALIGLTLLVTDAAYAKVTWVYGSTTAQCEKVSSQSAFLVPTGWRLWRCGSPQFPPFWKMSADPAPGGFPLFSIGFGKITNLSLEYSGTHSDRIEWGGNFKKGKFIPEVAILRTEGDWSDPFDKIRRITALQVFRLLADGTSCNVGVVAYRQNLNTRARALAARSIKRWRCLSKPKVFMQ